MKGTRLDYESLTAYVIVSEEFMHGTLKKTEKKREPITITRGFSLTTRLAKSWHLAKFVQNYS